MRATWIAALLLLAAPSAPAETGAAELRALRDVDVRLAAIGHRLVVTNAALCAERMPATGLVLHALDQYAPALRPAARAAFGFATPVAVEGVVPASPADEAGVRGDDGLATVAGHPLAPVSATAASSAGRDAALARIEAAPADAPLALTVVRGGAPMAVTLPTLPGCRAAFEVMLGDGFDAQSDARVVQIGLAFFRRFSDAETAVIVAHELAHVILRHTARLAAAGVSKGVLREIGRNGRLNRQAEVEADLLSVHLLRNAGYDPASAPRFWRAHGGTIDRGLLRSRTHPSSRARAEAIAAELARLPADAPVPYRPEVLARAGEAMK